jgi:hypothetical protein
LLLNIVFGAFNEILFSWLLAAQIFARLSGVAAIKNSCEQIHLLDIEVEKIMLRQFVDIPEVDSGMRSIQIFVGFQRVRTGLRSSPIFAIPSSHVQQ